MPIIVHMKDVADFFGVTIKTIYQWVKVGCPRQESGSFDLKEVFKWWLENIAAESETSDIQSVKLEYWKAKAAIEKLREANMRGELIQVSLVEQEFTRRVHIFRSGFVLLLDRLPPLLSGLDAEEIRKILEDEFDRILKNYAAQLSFEKVVIASCDDEEEEEEEEGKKKIKRRRGRKKAK